MTAVPGKQGSFYYRDLLNPQAKAFYDSMLARFSQGDYSGHIALPVTDCGSTGADCQAAFQALRDDHPELFYLSGRYTLTGYGQQTAIKCDILYREQDIPRIRHQLRKRISRLVRGTAGKSMAERERLVYERVAMQLSYVDNHDYRDHNIVGPVLQSAGVCEGYNALLMLCLRQLGIPCIKVYGKSGQGGWHCWSIAWIRGTPVHCDVTWETLYQGTVFFDYFNLSDEQIGRDHFSFQGGKIPVCTAENLNYYRLHQCSFQSQKAFVRHVRSGIGNIRSAPVFAQLSFADTEEALQAAVNRALRACGTWPPCRIRMNPTLQTAVLIAA